MTSTESVMAPPPSPPPTTCTCSKLRTSLTEKDYNNLASNLPDSYYPTTIEKAKKMNKANFTFAGLKGLTLKKLSVHLSSKAPGSRGEPGLRRFVLLANTCRSAFEWEERELASGAVVEEATSHIQDNATARGERQLDEDLGDWFTRSGYSMFEDNDDDDGGGFGGYGDYDGYDSDEEERREEDPWLTQALEELSEDLPEIMVVQSDSSSSDEDQQEEEGGAASDEDQAYLTSKTAPTVLLPPNNWTEVEERGIIQVVSTGNWLAGNHQVWGEEDFNNRL